MDSVVDPHWFQCGSGSSILGQCGSGSGSRSRLLMTKICKIFQLEKKFKFFWSKIALFLSLGLHKGRPSYKTNLQPSKGNTQHQNQCGSMRIHADPCGSGSTTLVMGIMMWILCPIELGSNSDFVSYPTGTGTSAFLRKYSFRQIPVPSVMWIGIVLMPIRIRIRLSLMMPIQIRIRILP